MRQPVTIGDQKFVWSDEKKAWIDDKTKVIANQGMQSLLEVASNSMFASPQNVQPIPNQTNVTPPANDLKPIEVTPPSTIEKKAEPVYNGEPVNIGGQKFILDPNKGWLDAKTKQLASKDVTKLLEQITGVKTEKKLGTDNIEIEPITIGGTKYIWNPKQQQWIDAKTKEPADKAVQALLTSTITKAGISKLSEVDFGSVGKAAEEKVKTPKEPAQKNKKVPATYQAEVNKKNKRLLVDMITKLKSIDATIRASSKAIAERNRREYADAREAAIEQGAKESLLEKQDATRTGGGMALPIAAVVAIVATQFEPIKEALSTAYRSIERGIDYTSSAVKTINDMFDSIFSLTGTADTPETEETQSTEKKPVPPVPKAQAAAPVASPRAPVQAKPAPEPVKTPQIRAAASSSAPSAASSPQKKEPPKATTTQTPQRATRIAASAPMQNVSKRQPPTQKRNTSGIPRGDIVALGRYLQKQGLVVSEQSKFGRVGKHGKNSAHYHDAALDVNAPGGIVEANDPMWRARFDKWARDLDAAGYTVLWRTKGHDNHIHVQLGGRGIKGGRSIIGRGKGRYIGKKSGYADPNSPMDGGGYAQEQATENTLIESLKSIVDVARGIGKTDSEYMGTIEKMTKDKTNRISDITAKKYADMVSRNLQDSDEARKRNVLELPNLNRKGGSTVQTPSTSFDKIIIDQYLRYFGFRPKTINL